MTAEEHPTPLDRAAMMRRLDRAAPHFDAADFVYGVTREGLLKRLAPVTIDADIVLDLGCATGAARRALEHRFRGSLVVGCDLSAGMLAAAAGRRRWFSQPALLRADALRLPLANQSIDVVFANQLLPWVDDLAALFAEVQRVLRADGLFAFSTLGPDSLRQLDAAWRQVDDTAHVRRFVDMHDVGDVAVAAGLRDPVLDIDRLGLTYRDTAGLLADLDRAAVRNSLAGRRRALLGRHRWARFLEALDALQTGGLITLDLEIVYGHCWGSGQAPGPHEIAIDATRIAHRST